MSAPRAIVVRASAGTGKTFRLAHRYLALLFAGAQPEEILATTFTRKAAGEILGRILTRLAEAARNEDARCEMIAHLAPKPKQEPSAQACAALLGSLLARLHAFQVRTMDSWFVHLAHLHGPELGLPPTWRMLDPAEATEQAAEQASALITSFDEARVRDLVSDLQQQEFHRGVHEGLVALTNDGLEILRDSTEKAWRCVDEGKAPTNEEVETLRSDLETAEFPTGKRWQTVRSKLMDAVENHDWEAWALIGPIKNLRAGDPSYYKQAIPPELLPVLEAGTALARSALLHERARRLAAARELLIAADERVDAARRRAGAFDFGDLPRWLSAAAWVGESTGFRLDGRVRHVLLDEFQDTASPQWRALRPMVSATLDDEGTLFCVGDGKQSIYGWRSGEPRLLGAVADATGAATEPLAKSFRTAQAVLDEINVLFSTLPASVDGWHQGEAVEIAAARFAEHWEDHSTAKQNLPGRFELWAAPVPDGAKAAVEVRTQAMARATAIAEELRAAGRPEASVAILTRKNDDVAAMVTELRARGVEASAEGNVALTESLVVAAALAALDLADHPDDTSAARLVEVSPLAVALDWKTSTRESFALRVRRELMQEGYGPWLARLAASAMTADAPWADLDARRFARLIESGYQWDAKARARAAAVLRPSAFAAHARELRMEDPSPAAVRVMTVHKSKGLEFDAVVLALTGGRGGRSAAFWTQREDPTEARSGVAFAGNEATRHADPEGLDALEQATEAARGYDELCVLYVGMTRAKQRLEVVLPEAPEKVLSEEQSESQRTFSLAGWMRAHHRVVAGNANEAVHSSGAARGEWGARAATPPAAAQLSSVAAGQAWSAATAVRGKAPPSVLPRWTASHVGKDEAVPLRVLTAAPRDDARPRGIAMHKLFEQIEWLEDFRASDEELLTALQGLDDPPDAQQARAWIREFRAMLDKPQIRAALTRPAGAQPEHLTVWRERRFAVVLPEPGRSEAAILRGSFDRVVLIGKPGAPESAKILDFKTGEVPDAETERSKREQYAPQMDVYRKALSRLLSMDENQITPILCFVDADSA